VDPQRTWSGFIGGWRDGSRNLFLCNWREVTQGERRGIVGLYRGNLWAVCDKETLLESSAHLNRIMGKSGVGGEKGGYMLDRATFPPCGSFP